MKMILRRIELILERYFDSREKEMLMKQVPFEQEEWLDNVHVMQLLGISESTFYRFVKILNWKMKLIGRRKHYLKSSILGT
jgi:predicted DNA-binding transcriptional regulator AlpA